MKYKHFGAMICCSSNAVMKVETVKEFIDLLAKMGYNLLEIGIDDLYTIDDEPYFGYLRGGYTKEEIREMDTYAQSQGIELVPCIQTLAHLTNLVKLPHYADIVDVNDILLVDNPKTYELIEKMFYSLSQQFTTRKVNIGMDEAHMIGLGNYLKKNGYKNRFEILLRHLERVKEIAARYGFTVHMWSDMFYRLANGGEYSIKGAHVPKEVAARIPEGVELAYWEYLSTDEGLYDELFTSHKGLNRPIWFAGSACTSNGFAPFNRLSLNALQVAMKQVKKHEIENVLITLWGDDGNDCSYFTTLPTLYAARQFADGNFDMDKIAKGFEEMFGVPFEAWLTLDIPNKSEKNPELLGISNACKSLLFNDCFLGWKDSALAEQAHIPYAEYAAELRAVKAGKYSYLFENLATLCDVLEIKAELGLRTRRAYQAQDKTALKELLKDYEEAARRVQLFRKSFRGVWMKENKPYSWEVHEIRLGGLYARINDCKERLEAYLAGEVTEIPELNETILPYANWGLQYNLYRGLVTVSEL